MLKKIALLLLLIVPMSVFAQKFGHLKSADVLTVIALTLLESSIIERTVAQCAPTSVTIPTKPLPAITFWSTKIPSSLPRLMVNVEYQFPEFFAMTSAAILSYSLYC